MQNFLNKYGEILKITGSLILAVFITIDVTHSEIGIIAGLKEEKTPSAKINIENIPEFEGYGIPETPTPTPVPQAVMGIGNQAPTIPPLFDCTLYTGRVIRADRATCDDFTARRYDPYEDQGNGNGEGLSAEEIQYMIQLESAKQQNSQYQRDQELAEYGECTEKAFSNYNACGTGCDNERSYGDEACFAAYAGANPLIENSESKLNECHADSDSIWRSCVELCNNDKSSALEGC